MRAHETMEPTATGCARRDLVAAYTRGRSDRGSRIDAAVRAMEDRYPRPVPARRGSDDSVTTSVAIDPDDPSESPARVASTSPVPRPPANPRSPDAARPPRRFARPHPSLVAASAAASCTATDAAAAAASADAARRRAAIAAEDVAVPRAAAATRPPEVRTSRGRVASARGVRTVDPEVDARRRRLETNRGRANGRRDEAGMSRFLAKYGLESAPVFPTR